MRLGIEFLDTSIDGRIEMPIIIIIIISETTGAKKESTQQIQKGE